MNDDEFKDVPPQLTAALDAVFAYGRLPEDVKGRRPKAKSRTVKPKRKANRTSPT